MNSSSNQFSSTVDNSEVLVSVKDVGKMYKLYDKPVERLKDTLFWRLGRHYGHEFWALHGVSMEVKRGESIGIVGRNGSGKSTLLQIIAGVLQPTEGTVSVKGRVSALLELGSGFNPEYTGRENVFLSGAVLGHSRADMEQKFDDIASFADIGQFIDQPVKLYSSGMFARLAFALSININPDVFIIDEALSVGDIFFQAKCYAKLEEYRNSGGTFLFVTHDTYTLQRICNRSIVLEDGKLVFEGESVEAANLYYKLGHQKVDRELKALSVMQSSDKSMLDLEKEYLKPSAEWPTMQDLKPGSVELKRDFTTGDGTALIENAFIFNSQNEPTTTFEVGEWMSIYVKVMFIEAAEQVSFGVGIRDKTGVLIGGANSWYTGKLIQRAPENSTYLFMVRIKLDLTPGAYLLVIATARDLTLGAWMDYGVLWDCCSIQVAGEPKFWGQSALSSLIETKVLETVDDR